MTEHRFHTPEPIRLLVQTGKGSVRVSATDTQETYVRVEGRGAEDAVSRDGDQISVIAPRTGAGFLGGEPELDVTVILPADSEARVKTGSADIEVEGRLGQCQVKSGSGEIVVAAVEGGTALETGSGDIEVRYAAAPLRVKSGSGDVRLGSIQAATAVSVGSGDVEVGRAEGATAVKTGSGDLVVTEVRGDLSFSTGSGDLTVGTAHAGSLVANGASGDVEVGVPAGVPVWTDITTTTGSIRSSLVGAGQPEEGQDHLEIRARSVTGDIVLRQL